MAFPIEYSEHEELEYTALDTAISRQRDRIMRAAKKAFDAGKYSKAVDYYHRAVMLMPTFEAVYGRTSALIRLGKLKEIPEAYRGGKSETCFYILYKACSTLMLLLQQQEFTPDEFTMYLNDAWDNIVELQQGMRCNQESIVNVVGELKTLLDNVDDSTSWDSVSMKEKGAKITNIANLLKIFQQQLRKLVECKEISDPGSGLSSVGSNEVSA